MKIILSPSKTQDINNLTNMKAQDLINSDKTRHLFSILKSFSKSQIKEMMKINKKLLDETYDVIQKHHDCSLTKEAIKLYQGLAFEEINMSEYNQNQKEYLNKHLIILSAMYGALKPNSLICPYRLDMTMKPNAINLYDYWQDDIIEFFKGDDLIINLASNEFSKMLKPIKDKMIAIEFKEKNKNGQLKTISVNAKKARGNMVQQLTLNLIKDIEKIKALVVNDYYYDDEQSSNNNLVFIKK